MPDRDRFAPIDTRHGLGPGEDWLKPSAISREAIVRLLEREGFDEPHAEAAADRLLMSFGLLWQDLEAVRVAPDLHVRSLAVEAQSRIDWLICLLENGFGSKDCGVEYLWSSLPAAHELDFSSLSKPRKVGEPGSHRVRTSLERSLAKAMREDGTEKRAHISSVVEYLKFLKLAMVELERGAERDPVLKPEKAERRRLQLLTIKGPDSQRPIVEAAYEAMLDPDLLLATTAEPMRGRPESPGTSFVQEAATIWFSATGFWPPKTEAVNRDEGPRLRGRFIDLLRKVESAYGAQNTLTQAAILNGIARARAAAETPER